MKKYTYNLFYLVLLTILISINLSCSNTNESENIEPGTVDRYSFTKGVNLSDWFLANSVDEIHLNQYRKSGFEQIKSLGVDIIRLPIRFYMMTGDGPEYKLNDEFWRKFDYALDLAEEVGLNIIIDNHSYFSANPFPGKNAENQVLKIWEQVAKHCKNRSQYIYYELMNEPDGEYLNENWPRIQGQLIKTIRAIDTEHYIIVASTDISTLQNLPDYNDEKLIYTFHFYDPFLFTHQGAKWKGSLLGDVENVPFPYNKNTMPQYPASMNGVQFLENLYKEYPTEGTEKAVKELLDRWLAFGQEKGLKLFCGEFGVLMDVVDDSQRCYWYKIVREYLEQKGIAWTMWDYRNSFGLYKKGQSYRFEKDLNLELLKAMNFTIPESYQAGVISDITFYKDDISEYMEIRSFNTEGVVDFYSTTFPYEGKKSISWTVGDQWAAIGIGAWPILDLKEQVGANFQLQFAFRSNKPVKLEVRFVQYSGLPWRNSFTLTEEMTATDGKWKVISIPLSSFKETGSVVNGNFKEQEGLFDWGKTHFLEFATEGNGKMIGAKIGIDNVVLTKPTLR